jgi:SAM-dependent methyltransferase
MASERSDNWSAGRLYEPYVGRWSRLVAKDFLAWLEVRSEADWLDVGCGTGALTEIILQQGRPRAVKGVDPSAGFVDYAKGRISDGRASFAVGDAQSLPVQSSRYDAVVSGLVLNFVPQPALAVSEMLRAAKPKGVIAAYVWDYAGKMELMRYFWDAAGALDPAAFDLDEGRRFPLCRPDRLDELFTQAGLHEVKIRAIDVPTRFQNFDDYWAPFLGGQGPAPGYAMSLSEERRGLLRERIRSKLPVASDGTINLVARAWSICGRGAPD